VRTLEARVLLVRPLDLDRDPRLHRQREQLAVVAEVKDDVDHVVLARAVDVDAVVRSAPALARPGSASPPARSRPRPR
jgi:hypothetical protein